jgi:YbgC/YbaW family acyl-CoA thioester hydrolase
LSAFRVREHVRWSDVDVSGLIRWDAYTRFVELAETELFRAAGYPYATLWQTLDIWLPRVQFHLDLRTPARLDEPLETAIGVRRIGRSSIQLDFTVAAGVEPRAEGSLTIVAVSRGNGKATPVPEALARALDAYRVEAKTV